MKKEQSVREFEDFLTENRSRVNKSLNTALWLFAIMGPALAVGVKAGFFQDVTYRSCAIITGLCLGLALLHFIFYKLYSKERRTALFALIALDILQVYMSYTHVNISLGWCIVPVLSLLFCDTGIYFYALIVNYVVMFISLLMTAAYDASVRNDFEHAGAYFASVAAGYTIETIILFAATFTMLRLIRAYFKEIFTQNALIRAHEKNMEEKIELLDSMSQIYDHVNLVDYQNSTEMSLRDSNSTKYQIDLDAQRHTIMDQKLKGRVEPEQYDEFMRFTDIKTVRRRLAKKKSISADFVDVVSGWFRAQFITVDATIDGIPNRVIYTIQNVEEEKRREQQLIRISETDEMTRLYNRRSYDEDLDTYRGRILSKKLVIFCVDVNGLKTVNDTMGHAAGDELILGAAKCLREATEKFGKVYRTGGDEFMMILHTEVPEAVRESILQKAAAWRGENIEQLTMSVGYAAAADHPGESVERLEQLADAEMYKEKDRYYKEKGIDRRR
ncbi:MAG: GGDEF domain-containing protein [Lachnospiraceae bacterium]|nr:GGDEF domain-containing protein [Lachnospiraceae bacterium]